MSDTFVAATPASRAGRPQGAVIFAAAAMLLLLTIGYGFEHRIPVSAWALYFRIWSGALLAGLLLLAWALTRSIGTVPAKFPTWGPPLACGGMFALTAYFWLPTLTAVMVTAGVLGLMSIFIRRGHTHTWLHIVLLANFGLAVFLTATTSINKAEADMLPILGDMNQHLLAGSNPYDQEYSNLAYYLPLQWLAFLPGVALGIDLRYENLLALGAVSVAVAVAAAHGRFHPAGLALIGAVLTSRVVPEMVLRGLVWPYWALLLGFGWLMLEQRWRGAAVAAGLLLTTQQPATLIVLLSGWYVLIHRGWREAAVFGGIAVAIYAAILAPWVWLRPTLLQEIYIHIQQKISLIHAADPQRDWKEISLLNLLQAAGLTSLRQAAQLAILGIGLGAIAIERNMSVPRLCCTIGVTFLAAISLNVQVFKHYYYPGLWLLALGANGLWACRHDARPVRR